MSKTNNAIESYTVQTRQTWRTIQATTLADAVSRGMALGVPFDVSSRSGAIVWAWEQRDGGDVPWCTETVAYNQGGVS